MPIYEYECTECEEQIECLQKISEAPLTDCPKCKQPTLNKKISAAGFQLKGTGWYVTDFKNQNKTKKDAKKEKSKTATDSNNNKKNEQKTTDNKTETKSTNTKKTS